MTAEDWLPWVDRAYFGAAIIAAVATALTVVAGIAQYRLNARISENKDRTFNEFRVNSEARVAELQKLAAEANQKAEEEKLARIKIEARLAPRSLDAEQIAGIKASLEKYAGIRLDVFACGDTPEIGHLIGTLVPTLLSAGWIVRTWAGMGGAGLGVVGIPVQTQTGANAEAENAADALVGALRAAGLDSARVTPFSGTDVPMAITGPTWDKTAVGPVRMLVGSKP